MCVIESGLHACVFLGARVRGDVNVSICLPFVPGCVSEHEGPYSGNNSGRARDV